MHVRDRQRETSIIAIGIRAYSCIDACTDIQKILCTYYTGLGLHNSYKPLNLLLAKAMGFSTPLSSHCIRQHPTATLLASTSIPHGLPYSTTCSLVALHFQSVKCLLMISGPLDLIWHIFLSWLCYGMCYLCWVFNVGPKVGNKA